MIIDPETANNKSNKKFLNAKEPTPNIKSIKYQTVSVHTVSAIAIDILKITTTLALAFTLLFSFFK